jgi:hypothetical protein
MLRKEEGKPWQIMMEYIFSTSDTYSVNLLGVIENGNDDILLISDCVNGTGGCGYNFYRLSQDGKNNDLAFSEIKEGPSFTRLENKLKDNQKLSRTKSADPDLQNMTWDINFALPEDPNCCSSYVAKAKLKIVGDSLEIANYELVQDKPR